MQRTLDREHEGASPRLNLNFRKVRLETVLDHLYRFAGLPIGIKGDVQVECTIDLWHDRPVSTAEALWLLKQRLMQMGCMLIQRDRTFSVIRTEDVKKNWIALPTI